MYCVIGKKETLVQRQDGVECQKVGTYVRFGIT
jgi:hypothetical protein